VDAWSLFEEWTRTTCRGTLGASPLKERTFSQRFVTAGQWGDVGIHEVVGREEFEGFMGLARKLSADIRQTTLESMT